MDCIEKGQGSGPPDVVSVTGAGDTLLLVFQIFETGVVSSLARSRDWVLIYGPDKKVWSGQQK